MDTFNKFYLIVKETFKSGVFGISVFEFFLIFLSIFFSIILRSFFANLIIDKLKKIIKKTGNKIDDNLFNSLSSPLKLLPIVFIFIFFILYVNIDTRLGFYLEKFNRSLTTIFVFWFMHQSILPISSIFEKLDQILSKALSLWLIKSIKYLIIFLGIVAVLEIWGIKIGPIIAGLGLFGVAVALGAQDLFKNLISGILIITEKRFNLGDVIELKEKVTGTVEHIGFRSTSIRQFDSTIVSLPNYFFSDSAIINFSHRKHRRIKWIIGLTYNTSVSQLKKICDEISEYILSSDNFIVNDNYQLFVRVEKFNDSSIDILIYCFTNTNDWEKFLEYKQQLAFQIKEIVDGNSSSFAFPSTSVYIEKE